MLSIQNKEFFIHAINSCRQNKICFNNSWHRNYNIAPSKHQAGKVSLYLYILALQKFIFKFNAMG